MQPQQNPFEFWASQRGDACALVTPNERISWQQLAGHVSSIARQLAEQGVTAGSVVTLVGKDSQQMLWYLLGAMHLGAITALTMPQPKSLLKDKLDALYKHDQAQWRWLDANAEREAQLCSTLQPLLWTDSLPHVTSNYCLDALATIVFTSGSTGRPKAVAHSHAQHFASANGLLQKFAFTCDDTWLLSLPIYHVSGLSIIYRWLAAGGCLKLASGDLHQDIQDATHASLVPTQLQRLLTSSPPLKLTHVLLGGGHIPTELAERANALGVQTWIGYGMTEAASTISAKAVDGQTGVGDVLPNRQVKIEGNHIFVGGDTLASGYYFQGMLRSLRSDSGWFASGDLGRWQANQLHIIGRADNLFISGGENIHCEEVEAALVGFPKVLQAFVVPIESEEFGARPVAILDVPSLPPRDKLEAWLHHHLVKFKWPDHYFLMPEALKQSGIKVSRQALKQWLNETTEFEVIS